MKGYLALALVCFAGSVLGLTTAQQAVGGRYGIATETKGPWRVWTTAAQPRTDPYTRAHRVSYGFLPSNRFETLEFEAQLDSEQSQLDASCTYVVSGPVPKARWWTILAVSGEDEQNGSTEVSNTAIARQLVYEPDGKFRIVVSHDPQAGNWIRPPETGPLVLVMRLYGPEPALRRAPLSGDLPVIERQVCR